MKVLIVGGANNASLAITQSLGKFVNSVDVVGLKSDFNKTFYSKYIRKKHLLESPEKSLSNFCNELVDIINSYKYDFIIPTNDRFSIILSLPAFKAKVLKSQLVVPPYDTLLKAMDKATTLKLAQKNGCPIPKTIFTDQDYLLNMDSINENLEFPVVIKPRSSWFIKGTQLVKGKINYITDPSDLKEAFLNSHENIPFPLIQHQIKGDAWGIELLFWKGKIEAAFSHRRIRESNPLGSYSSAVESISANEKYLGYIQKILAEIDWNGVCMFEFKNDDSDDIPKLMEINGRFWGSLPVAIKSGVDFPKFLIQLYRNMDISYANEYELGVKGTWLIADLVHLYHVMKGKPKKWQGYFPDRIGTLKEFLKLNQYNSYNNEKEDLIPGILELIVEPAMKLKRKLAR